MNTSFKKEYIVATDVISFPGRLLLKRAINNYLVGLENGNIISPPIALLKDENPHKYTLYYNNKLCGEMDKDILSNISLKEDFTVEVVKHTINDFTICFSNETKINKLIDDIRKEKDSKLSDYEKRIIKVCKEKYFFNQAHIDKLIEYWNNLPDYNDLEKDAVIPNLETIELYIDDIESQVILTSFLSVYSNLFLYYAGPASTGKNIALITLSCILKQPYVELSVHEEIDKRDLLGSETIKNEKMGNEVVKEIVYEPDILLLAMEKGYICVLDEFNFGSSGLFPLLNSCSDSRKSMYIPHYKKIMAHKNFIICLTGNEGYAGTSEQNTAFLSRYNKITFEYPLEISKLVKGSLGDKINKLYTILRKKVIKEKTLSEYCIFVRCFIAFDKMTTLGADDIIALKSSLTNKIPRQTDAETVLDLWKSIL